MSFHLYILYSRNLDAYYVGHTGDKLEERLRRHNSDHKGYTSRAKDWCIIFSESYHSKEKADEREREIKSWKSRKKILALIGSDRTEHTPF